MSRNDWLITNFLFLLICGSLAPASLRAQEADSAAIRLFNSYYLSNIEGLRELNQAKGSSFYCDPPGNPYRAVHNYLDAYGERRDSLGVIFYSVDSTHLRTWLLARGRLYFHEQPAGAAVLREMESRLRDALQVSRLQEADRAQRGLILRDSSSRATGLGPALREATSLLMPPKLANQLSGLRHLIFITEYNIGMVPLYLLKPFGNESYLIDSLSISLGPHLCNLGGFADLNRDVLGQPQTLLAAQPLVVGDPLYARSMSAQLPSLPGAREEAKMVHAITGGRRLLGAEAGIKEVKRLSQQSDLLYFATHGYFDFDQQLKGSFLAFTPDASDPRGLWTADQIQSERFTRPHSMAILSACQTGVGKVYRAGFLGLGHVFYKAGVDHTIMSLWSVSDEATKKLMELFIKKLKNEPRPFYPASHLRAAMLEFKIAEPNPTLWAPFVLFGFPY